GERRPPADGRRVQRVREHDPQGARRLARNRRVQVRRPGRGRVQGPRVGAQNRHAPGEEQVRLHRRRPRPHEEGQQLRKATLRPGTEEQRRRLEVALFPYELGPRPAEV
ncbi:MAG: hypothetical protein AVDCRST_MAG02-3038, partial [uncultured Rubrobacteraceae bacterium]